jgi:outer membrane protein TolC
MEAREPDIPGLQANASPPTRAYQKRPETTNPPASALGFAPADEARDVAARLERHARDAGVVGLAEGRVLSLQEALRLAQRQSREFLSAQEQYLLAAISLLVERHLWGPRFFNDTSVIIGGNADDGNFEHALSVINTLRATQRLPAGGSIEARWVWQATEQLRETASGRYRQSSALVLSGEVPLLRGAGSVAREDLIQTERNLVYAAREFERFRRTFLVDIAQDYFELQNAKAVLVNQERQLQSLRDNARRTAARVAAGRLEAFEQGIAENEVLSAEASLASQRESYALQLERFKIRLGLDPSERIIITEDTLEVPEPEIVPEDAGRLALEYRLDLQNQRDRLDDAARGVANARNALLPDLNLAGSVTFPTDDDARVGSLALSPDDLRYEASLTLALPLDRRVEQLRLRASLISLERARREYEKARDDVVVAVRAALRRIELARFQLRLAEQAVEINRKRRRGQELRADTVTTQALVDSENALLAAENQRDRARTNLRIAVLNYLLESDQLRVARDGTLEMLPGMKPSDNTPVPQ